MNKPYIITLANRKGGVAKTTTALAIASYFKKKGIKTLLIDLDSQANLSTFTNTYKEGENNTLNLMLNKPFKIKNDILTTDYTLSLIEEQLKGKGNYLLKCIKCIYDKYKYELVIIDTSPSLSTLTLNGIIASNYLIIPTQAEKGAYEGTKQTLNIIEKAIKPTKDIVIGGIVITGFNDRSILHKQFITAYTDLAKKYKTKLYKHHIPKGIAIAEAEALGEDILTYSPSSKPAKAYIELAKEIEKDIFNK